MYRNLKTFMKPLFIVVFSIVFFSAFCLNAISSSGANTDASVELNTTNSW